MSLHGLQAHREQPRVNFEETGEEPKASPFAAQLKFGLADSIQDITKLNYSTPCSTLHSVALVMDGQPDGVRSGQKPPAVQERAGIGVKDNAGVGVKAKTEVGVDDKPVVTERDKAEVAAREKHEKEVRELIADLGADKYATRQQATRRLIELGLKAFPTIVEAVQSKDAEVRYRAASVCQQLIGEDQLSAIDILPAQGADGAPTISFSMITPEWRDYYETETNKRLNAVEKNIERNGALQKMKELYDAGALRLSYEQADVLTKEVLISQNIDRVRAVFSLDLANYHKTEDPRKAARYIETALRQEPKFAKDDRTIKLIADTDLPEDQEFLKRFESLGGSREQLNLAYSKVLFERANDAIYTDPADAQKYLRKAFELNPDALKSDEAPRLIARSGLADDERIMEQYKKLGGSLPNLQYECLRASGDEVLTLIGKNKKAFEGSADKKAALKELKVSFEKAIALAERQSQKSAEFLAQVEMRHAEIYNKLTQEEKDAFRDPDILQEAQLRRKYPGLLELEEQKRVLLEQKRDNPINSFEAAFVYAQAQSQAGDKESARALLTKAFEQLKKSTPADIVKQIVEFEEISPLMKELGLSAGK